MAKGHWRRPLAAGGRTQAGNRDEAAGTQTVGRHGRVDSEVRVRGRNWRTRGARIGDCADSEAIITGRTGP